MRKRNLGFFSAVLLCLGGCGYHTLGAATHLPPDAHTLSVPVFKTRTVAYHYEFSMTNAVIREFAARTKLKVTPTQCADTDVVLHGTILQEVGGRLTYRTQTQQSSS